MLKWYLKNLLKIKVYLSNYLSALFVFNLKTFVSKKFSTRWYCRLEPVFFDKLVCAFNYGDQHPLFSTLIWTSSRITEWPEYFISGIIILFAVLTITLFFNFLEKLYSYNLSLVGSEYWFLHPFLIHIQLV